MKQTYLFMIFIILIFPKQIISFRESDKLKRNEAISNNQAKESINLKVSTYHKYTPYKNLGIHPDDKNKNILNMPMTNNSNYDKKANMDSSFNNKQKITIDTNRKYIDNFEEDKDNYSISSATALLKNEGMKGINDNYGHENILNRKNLLLFKISDILSNEEYKSRYVYSENYINFKIILNALHDLIKYENTESNLISVSTIFVDEYINYIDNIEIHEENNKNIKSQYYYINLETQLKFQDAVGLFGREILNHSIKNLAPGKYLLFNILKNNLDIVQRSIIKNEAYSKNMDVIKERIVHKPDFDASFRKYIEKSLLDLDLIQNKVKKSLLGPFIFKIKNYIENIFFYEEKNSIIAYLLYQVLNSSINLFNDLQEDEFFENGCQLKQYIYSLSKYEDIKLGVKYVLKRLKIHKNLNPLTQFIEKFLLALESLKIEEAKVIENYSVNGVDFINEFELYNKSTDIENLSKQSPDGLSRFEIGKLFTNSELLHKIAIFINDYKELMESELQLDFYDKILNNFKNLVLAVFNSGTFIEDDKLNSSYYLYDKDKLTDIFELLDNFRVLLQDRNKHREELQPVFISLHKILAYLLTFDLKSSNAIEPVNNNIDTSDIYIKIAYRDIKDEYEKLKLSNIVKNINVPHCDRSVYLPDKNAYITVLNDSIFDDFKDKTSYELNLINKIEQLDGLKIQPLFLLLKNISHPHKKDFIKLSVVYKSVNVLLKLLDRSAVKIYNASLIDEIYEKLMSIYDNFDISFNETFNGIQITLLYKKNKINALKESFYRLLKFIDENEDKIIKSHVDDIKMNVISIIVYLNIFEQKLHEVKEIIDLKFNKEEYIDKEMTAIEKCVLGNILEESINLSSNYLREMSYFLFQIDSNSFNIKNSMVEKKIYMLIIQLYNTLLQNRYKQNIIVISNLIIESAFNLMNTAKTARKIVSNKELFIWYDRKTVESLKSDLNYTVGVLNETNDNLGNLLYTNAVDDFLEYFKHLDFDSDYFYEPLEGVKYENYNSNYMSLENLPISNQLLENKDLALGSNNEKDIEINKTTKLLDNFSEKINNESKLSTNTAVNPKKRKINLLSKKKSGINKYNFDQQDKTITEDKISNIEKNYMLNNALKNHIDNSINDPKDILFYPKRNESKNSGNIFDFKAKLIKKITQYIENKTNKTEHKLFNFLNKNLELFEMSLKILSDDNIVNLEINEEIISIFDELLKIIINIETNDDLTDINRYRNLVERLKDIFNEKRDNDYAQQLINILDYTIKMLDDKIIETSTSNTIKNNASKLQKVKRVLIVIEIQECVQCAIPLYDKSSKSYFKGLFEI